MSLGKAYEAWQTVGAFFGALGTIGMGVLVYVGPDTIPEDLPQHRPVGVAIAAFGVVFMLAVVLGGRSGFGRRMRSLLLAAVCALIVFAAGRMAIESADGATRLAREGVGATARVTSATFVAQRKHFSPRAKITFAGHRATIRSTRRRGETFPVVYVPDDPSIVVPGRPGESFVDYAGRLAGSPAWFFGSAIAALVAAVAALVGLKGFLLGTPPQPSGGGPVAARPVP